MGPVDIVKKWELLLILKLQREIRRDSTGVKVVIEALQLDKVVLASTNDEQVLLECPGIWKPCLGVFHHVVVDDRSLGTRRVVSAAVVVHSKEIAQSRLDAGVEAGHVLPEGVGVNRRRRSTCG